MSRLVETIVMDTVTTLVHLRALPSTATRRTAERLAEEDQAQPEAVEAVAVVVAGNNSHTTYKLTDE